MILIIFGGAAFLAIMFWTVLLPFKPASLKVFGKLVCRKNEKMEILTSVASYHQPGEKSIEIYCSDYGKRRDVKGKTLLLAFLTSFVLMFPVSVAIVIVTYKFLAK